MRSRSGTARSARSMPSTTPPSSPRRCCGAKATSRARSGSPCREVGTPIATAPPPDRRSARCTVPRRCRRTGPRPSRTGSPAAFALACLAICAALLTRQAFAWLVPVAAFFLLRRELGARPALRDLAAVGRTAGGIALLGLAVVPLAALALEWNGLVPPSADPASCGLCDDRRGLARESFTLRTVGFTIALAGLYGAAVFGPSLWRRLRMLRSPQLRAARSALRSPGAQALLGGPTARALRASPAGRALEQAARGAARGVTPPSRRSLALAATAGVALLLVSPLLYKPIRPGQSGDAGYLWKLSDRLPELLGSSFAFWLLVPLGCVTLLTLIRRAGAGSRNASARLGDWPRWAPLRSPRNAGAGTPARPLPRGWRPRA